MFIQLKTKIWLTVFTIVLIFSFFTLYYFPDQQSKNYLSIYNREAENLAKTVALGVKIAMDEEYYEGEKEALKFATEDKRLKFVSLLSAEQNGKDTILKIMNTVPNGIVDDTLKYQKGSIIAKLAPFDVGKMSGAVLLVFSTEEINNSIKQIRVASIIVSAIVFMISILIGFWLARNISVPVLALRDAANKVGKGDLSQKVINNSGDEIGELGNAFNKMVNDLATASEKLKKANVNLENTIDDLKAAQSQLIQSEKMASLGELTAGIAHEIQNPLNFVNNFSEVNKELLFEMKEEMDKGNLEDAKAIANNLIDNEEKINLHGKRADGIVKGMLQHSQKSSGQKEFVNINGIADECLKLSYHSMRSKDKSFQANLETDFDGKIDKISFIPQDIVRVLVNLFNNAFYAINEKKKSVIDYYQPTVSVSTKKTENQVSIIVRDNGNGIPLKIIDKIFQPFFTTKPTGQGTGLGLSLSYDIIKAHGGEIKMNTKENEGSEFIIELPLK